MDAVLDLEQTQAFDELCEEKWHFLLNDCPPEHRDDAALIDRLTGELIFSPSLAALKQIVPDEAVRSRLLVLRVGRIDIESQHNGAAARWRRVK